MLIVHVCQDSNGDGGCSPDEPPLANQAFEIVADDGRRWLIVSDLDGRIVLPGFKEGQSVTVTQIIDPVTSPWIVTSPNPQVVTLVCGDNHVWFANRLPGLPVTGFTLEPPERSWQLRDPPEEVEAIPQAVVGVDIVPERSWELRPPPAKMKPTLPSAGVEIVPERSWELREHVTLYIAPPSTTTNTGEGTASDIFEAPIQGWMDIGNLRIPLGETRVEDNRLLVLNEAGGWSLGPRGGVRVNWHANQFPLEGLPERGDRIFVYYAGERRQFEVERTALVPAGQEGRPLENVRRGYLVAVTCHGKDWQYRLLIMAKEIKR